MQWIWILLIVVGVAGYGVYVWHTVAYSITISRPLIANTIPYEQHPQNPSMRILIAGDSTGVGVGSINNKTSIAGRVGSDFPTADITNISHSGDKLADLEKKLDARAGETYDIVLLQIGANDVTGRTSFEDIRSTLALVLTKANSMGKKVVVMTAGNIGLSPAFVWPLSSFITYRTREVRKIFMDEVAKNPAGSYVDLFKEAKDEIFNTDIPRYYAPDHFHPSGEGYGVWYANLKPRL